MKGGTIALGLGLIVFGLLFLPGPWACGFGILGGLILLYGATR